MLRESTRFCVCLIYLLILLVSVVSSAPPHQRSPRNVDDDPEVESLIEEILEAGKREVEKRQRGQLANSDLEGGHGGGAKSFTTEKHGNQTQWVPWHPPTATQWVPWHPSTSSPTAPPIEFNEEEKNLLTSDRLETFSGELLHFAATLYDECHNQTPECFKRWAASCDNETDCKSLAFGDDCKPVKHRGDATFKHTGPWNDTCFASSWFQEDKDPRRVLECSVAEKKCRCFGDLSDITRKLDHPTYDVESGACLIPLHHRCLPGRTPCDNKWPKMNVTCQKNVNKHAYLHEDKEAYYCLGASSHVTPPLLLLLLTFLILIIPFDSLINYKVD